MKIGLGLGLTKNKKGGSSGPTIATSPVISGDATGEGNTLTLTTAPVWTGATSSSYVWQRNGVDIVGSTNSTTVVVQAGENTGTYRVKATGTNAEGSTIAYSNTLTGVVLATLGTVPTQSFNWTDTLTVDLSAYVTDNGGDAALVYAASGAGVSSVNTSTGVVTMSQAVGTTSVSWSVTNDAGEATGTAFNVTIAAEAPAQVTGLSATAGDTQVSLSWSAPASNGSALTDYLIEVNIAGGGWTTVSDGTSTSTSYVHTGLTNGSEHVYRVSAINAIGTGTASATDSATPTAANTAPTISSATWTADGQTLDVTVSDDGGTVDIFIVSVLASGGDPSKAQIEAGTGAGIVESYSATDISGLTGQDLGFTASSDSPNADEIHMFIRDAGSLESAIYIIESVTFDATAPTISSSDPADNSTDHPIADNIVITFSESVRFGTGNIVLRTNNGGWADAETFSVTADVGTSDGQVQISGSTLTIYPTGDLTNSREYAVRIASTAIEDVYGNGFAGIADDTTLSFTTAAAASGISVRDTAGSATTTFTSSLGATMPTHATDDLLLLFVLEGNGPNVQTPSGWTQIAQISIGTDHGTVFRKIAASAAETVTVTFSSSSDTSAFVMSIDGANTTTPVPNVGTENDATSATSNTPGTVSCTAGDLGIAIALGDRNRSFTVSPATESYNHNPANKSTSVNLIVAVEAEAGTTTTSQTFSHSFSNTTAITFNVQAA